MKAFLASNATVWGGKKNNRDTYKRFSEKARWTWISNKLRGWCVPLVRAHREKHGIKRQPGESGHCGSSVTFIPFRLSLPAQLQPHTRGERDWPSVHPQSWNNSGAAWEGEALKTEAATALVLEGYWFGCWKFLHWLLAKIFVSIESIWISRNVEVLD